MMTKGNGVSISLKGLRPDAVRFLSEKTGIDFTGVRNFRDPDSWACFTFRRKGSIAVVIVCEFKTPWDAHLTVAMRDPHVLTWRTLAAMFCVVFRKAARITALIEPGNRVALQQVQRMGFLQEGYMRKGYDGERDAALFGLVPEQCPYLTWKPFRIRSVVATHPPRPTMQ